MIVNKVTVGYVVQEFDTETGKFISQEFFAGDQVDYEDNYGDPLEQNEVMPDPEPYLPLEMKQPDEMEKANES